MRSTNLPSVPAAASTWPSCHHILPPTRSGGRRARGEEGRCISASKAKFRNPTAENIEMAVINLLMYLGPAGSAWICHTPPRTAPSQSRRRGSLRREGRPVLTSKAKLEEVPAGNPSMLCGLDEAALALPSGLAWMGNGVLSIPGTAPHLVNGPTTVELLFFGLS